jgi:glucuronate isomerase
MGKSSKKTKSSPVKNPVTQDGFLLPTKTARRLYDVASEEPIYDYHCHLSPKEIAEDKKWADLSEIWLGGDHYKWRAMRANGVPESHITGSTKPYEKFLAFARTMPRLLRNPLWHWSHLELDRVFGIKEILNEDTAPKIWAKANDKLKSLSAQKILKQFRVRVVGTTDDPCDDLADHQKIQKSGIGTRVYPTFRPDKALLVDQPAIFSTWVQRLEKISGVDCSSFHGFLKALDQRHEVFHQLGSRISDHGMNQAFGRGGTRDQATRIYMAARKGESPTLIEAEAYKGFLMVYFGELDSRRGWTKQIHFGALRNGNSKGSRDLGPDTGFDSIGDWPQIDRLAGYMDELAGRGSLPKMVLYNLNPADNYAVATLCGSFQGEGARGKIQFGSGWWFLDQLEGMKWQINALSSLGLLANFVGMLTDSRSFLSYPRHEYFRRLLCQILGEEVENGALPKDMKLLEGMVRDICYRNAEVYFGMEPGKA